MLLIRRLHDTGHFRRSNSVVPLPGGKGWPSLSAAPVARGEYMSAALRLSIDQLFGLKAAEREQDSTHPLDLQLAALMEPMARRTAQHLVRWNAENLADALTNYVDEEDFMEFCRGLVEHASAMASLGRPTEAPDGDSGSATVREILQALMPGRGLSKERARLAEGLFIYTRHEREFAGRRRTPGHPTGPVEIHDLRAMMWANDMPETIRKGFYGTLEINALVFAIGGMILLEVTSPSMAWSREFARLFLLRGAEALRPMALRLGHSLAWVDGRTVEPPTLAELNAEVEARMALINQLMPGDPS